MRISDWSSDVCSSDLGLQHVHRQAIAVVDEAGAYAGRQHFRRQRSDLGHSASPREPVVSPSSVADAADSGYQRESGHGRVTMKVLIAGGCGFIGLATAERYLADGDEVVLFDRHDLHPRSEEHTSELQSLLRKSY